jgi:CBS domain-containing protein
VTPQDSLLDATRKMGVRGAGALPVVDGKTGRYLGLITRSHVLSAYHRTVTEGQLEAKAREPRVNIRALE